MRCESSFRSRKGISVPGAIREVLDVEVGIRPGRFSLQSFLWIFCRPGGVFDFGLSLIDREAV